MTTDATLGDEKWTGEARCVSEFRRFIEVSKPLLLRASSSEGIIAQFRRFINEAMPWFIADVQRLLPELEVRCRALSRWLVKDDLLAIAGCRFVEDAYTELMAWALRPETHPPSARRRQEKWLTAIGVAPARYSGTCNPRTQLHTLDGIPDLVMHFDRFAVCVEAKTASTEHEAPSGLMQTVAYVDSVRTALKLTAGDALVMVFLTPGGLKAANMDAVSTTYIEFVEAIADALNGIEVPAETRAAFAILLTHFITCATESNANPAVLIQDVTAWSGESDWASSAKVFQRRRQLKDAIDLLASSAEFVGELGLGQLSKLMI